LLLALAAVAATILVGSRDRRLAAVVVPYPHELAQVSFAVAGDVIPHEAVRAAAGAAATAGDPTNSQGWGALFSEVADVFQHADFGFVNLETPVAPAHSHGSKPFMFDAPLALLEGLKASGIKIVSFANNHVMDQGWPGFTETREHLRDVGLLFAGSGDTVQQQWQPVFTEANGIKVGWLGMTRWLNGNRNPDRDDQPHVNFFPYPGEAGGAPGADKAQVLAAVKAARAQCDFLVISIHWGIEYAPAPRPEDVDMAHKMLEAGASEEAQATEILEVAFDGEDLQIAFNPQYLLDGIGAIDSDTARISFTAPAKPAVITGKGDRQDYRYVLMPIRSAG